MLNSVDDTALSKVHINICVCTYKRPFLLKKLLEKVEVQVTDNLFSFSVVVIDNDAAHSAETVVEDFSHSTHLEVKYHVVAEQNISHARNSAVKHARGKYIVFVDDDEYPASHWLLELYKTLKHFNADGVLGPVLPDFEVTPPTWMERGKLLERKSFKTGTILSDARYTRTGNVILKRELFIGEPEPFDPSYGRTGGEDIDFFQKKLLEGAHFVWCDEAPVYEHVPPERSTRYYLIRRALLRGEINSKGLSILSSSFFKSSAAIVIYAVMLPFLLILGQHHFMKFLIKECDHLGKVLGVFGIKTQGTRSF